MMTSASPYSRLNLVGTNDRGRTQWRAGDRHLEARRDALNPPPYRDRLRTGILHFGPGAFHRAHQADYIDQLLQEDPRWGIAAVSLRTAHTVEALKSQGGLYTLAILDEQTSFRTNGAHTRFLGPSDHASVRSQLVDPALRIVTSTVTEKGYCLSGDGSLDFGHPDIVHDLASPGTPRSLIGWLALGLADRRKSNVAPFTAICCDNMANNGKKLANAVSSFASRIDSELARWINEEPRFPDTMVDSITPATDETLRRLVREKTGFDDQVPVAREAFAQWVIEDILPADSPDLASAGVTLTNEVNAWERAKLRILNGAHSALAYIGLLLGHQTVADAMRDPRLSSFVERLVLDDIIPSLPASSINLRAYADETFARFGNRAINHRLSQIAWDGSQKLPYRLLDTMTEARAAGRTLRRLVLPIAAWILFLNRQVSTGAKIVDPLADTLAERVCSAAPVELILTLRQVFPKELGEDPRFSCPLKEAFADMRAVGVAAAIDRALLPSAND
jgi:fructuronate reductase